MGLAVPTGIALMPPHKVEEPRRDVWIIALMIAGIVPGGLAIADAHPDERAAMIAHVAWIPLLETVSAAFVSATIDFARRKKLEEQARIRGSRARRRRTQKP